MATVRNLNETILFGAKRQIRHHTTEKQTNQLQECSDIELEGGKGREEIGITQNDAMTAEVH